ncbi:MAG: hypothetical protein ACHRXM_04510 [Isosphaerales bacterium]
MQQNCSSRAATHHAANHPSSTIRPFRRLAAGRPDSACIDDVPRSLLCVLQAVAAADQVFPARNALIYIICHEFGNALDHARRNDVSESNFDVDGLSVSLASRSPVTS